MSERFDLPRGHSGFRNAILRQHQIVSEQLAKRRLGLAGHAFSPKRGLRGSGLKFPSNGVLHISSSRKPAMENSTEKQIVRRAYELWEQAGKPEGRDQEFYHMAEQELRDADKASPLRIPDNL